MQSMHIFAGAGGGLLSDLILGHNPIVAVEWDPYACQILRERAADGWFPDLQVYEGDVRLFDPSEYAGRVDCIHAGFPCQDISVAGKQAGLGEGTRSGLYREVLRIAGVVRPRYLFLENVSAILSNGLGCVLGDLAAMGYDCSWLCIRASDVGAPHGRDRWFALAVRNSEHDGQPTAEVAGSVAQGSDSNQTWTQQAEQPARPSEQYDDVADTNSAQLEGNERAERSEQEYADTSISCGREVEPNMGLLATKLAIVLDANQTLQSWWEVEPQVGRVTTGCENRAAQLKALGNGQVPIQAAVAFSILIK